MRAALLVPGLILALLAPSPVRAAEREPAVPGSFEPGSFEAGRAAVARARDASRRPARALCFRPFCRRSSDRARNVVLFVGDGMSVATVTAARILDGQLRGEPGEENQLVFERFPSLALVKTYTTDMQVPDSAGTMTALVTGAKTRSGLLSVAASVPRGDAAAARAAPLETLLERAERRGLATGVVSTTTITHATPAAGYAHSPDRNWEVDAGMPEAVRESGFPDIARQLVEFRGGGDGLEVAFGGGRAHFLPGGMPDPARPDEPRRMGRRADGRDLTAEWSVRPGAVYVSSRAELDALDPRTVERVLGLFEPGHLPFETDRDPATGLSLAEMTRKALAILEREAAGFVLIVEGGRIDHAHHFSNAYRALHDTLALSRAVDVAVELTDPDDTLILVTADHGHVFTIAGYPSRGNPILGKVRGVDPLAPGEPRLARDVKGRPYTTLGYANGPGHREPIPDLAEVDTAAPTYQQLAAVPLRVETHSGEDVPAYARGPGSRLVRGVMEQNELYHVMVEALGWNEPARRSWLDRLLRR